MTLATMPAPDRTTRPSAISPRPALIPLGRHDARPPFALDRPVTLIGSRHRAHIRLESEEVSRSHAVVVNAGGRVYIRDLASRTRVYVNGREVHEAELADGDHVNIGHFALRFVADDVPVPPEPGADAAAPGTATLTGDGLDPAGVPLDGTICVVGCRPGVDLVLRGSQVSFAHAVIVNDGGRHLVRDLGSRTGTFVDGAAAEGDVELQTGDVIGIGPYRLRYTAAADAGSTAAAPATSDVAVPRGAEAALPVMNAAAETWFPPAEASPPREQPPVAAAPQPAPAARRPAAKPVAEVATVPVPEPAAEVVAAPPPAPAPPPVVPAPVAEAPPVVAEAPDAAFDFAEPPPAQPATPTAAAVEPEPIALSPSPDPIVATPNRSTPEARDAEAWDAAADELPGAKTVDDAPVEVTSAEIPTAEAEALDAGSEPAVADEPAGDASDQGYASIGLAFVGQTLLDEVVVPAMRTEPPMIVLAPVSDARERAHPTPAPEGAPAADEAAPEDAPEDVAPEDAPEDAASFDDSLEMPEDDAPGEGPDEIGAVIEALEGHRHGRDDAAYDEALTDLELDEPDFAAQEPRAPEPAPAPQAAQPRPEPVAPVARPAAAEPVPVPPRGAASQKPRPVSREERVAPVPPPTWGVLAKAVALAELPHAAPAEQPDDDAAPPRRGRKWLKVLVALAVLLAAAAGVALVVLKTDATSAVRGYF